MSLLDKIDQYISDAEDNFKNGRFDDAHAHFTQIAQHYFKTSEIDKAIYFSYRAIICKDVLNTNFDYLSDLLNLGINLIKFGLKSSHQQLENERDPWVATNYLNLLYQTMKSLEFPEQKKHIGNELIANYQIMVNEITTTPEEKMTNLEKLITLQDEFKLEKERKVTSKRLATLLIQMGDEIDNDEINIYRKHQLYNQALALTEGDEDKKILNEKIARVKEIINMN